MAPLTKVKDVANGTLYKDEKGVELILLKNVRISYPFLGEPSKDDKDDGTTERKFRVQAMLPKETHVAAKDLCKEVIERLIATAKKTDADIVVAKDKWFLTNGNDKEDKTAHGHWLVAASDARVRPTCRNERAELILDVEAIDQKFYGGCYGNVLIRPWYFNGTAKASKKKHPKRIVAGLSAVQFVRDGTAFGAGRVDDTDVFGVVEDEGGGSNDGMDDDDEL